MSAFETGERKAIPAVLIYAFRAGRVLMLHRNAREKAVDYHSGKWNGLGGKLEADESALEGARREFREESGIELPEIAFRILGILHFPNFKAHKKEDWIVTVFRAEFPREVELPETRIGEGELAWIPEEDLLSLPLWPGDRHFLPWVREDRPFYGTLWYEGETVARAEIRAI